MTIFLIYIYVNKNIYICMYVSMHACMHVCMCVYAKKSK